jgi:hypothetical protein
MMMVRIILSILTIYSNLALATNAETLLCYDSRGVLAFQVESAFQDKVRVSFSNLGFFEKKLQDLAKSLEDSQGSYLEFKEAEIESELLSADWFSNDEYSIQRFYETQFFLSPNKQSRMLLQLVQKTNKTYLVNLGSSVIKSSFFRKQGWEVLNFYCRNSD